MIAIALSLLSAVFVSVSGCIPAGLRTTGVRVDALGLRKDVVVDDANISYVERLDEYRTTDPSLARIAILDSKNIWTCDKLSRSLERLPVTHSCSLFPALMNVDSDDAPEILCRGGGFSDVGLQDDTGTPLWSRSGSWAQLSTATRMSAADVDGDGIVEFYVAASDGLYRLDRNGTAIWVAKSPDWQYWGVEVWPAAPPAHGVIAAAALRKGAAEKTLEIYDPSGTVIRRIPSSAMRDYDEFRLTSKSGLVSDVRIVGRNAYNVGMLDLNGNAIWSYSLPSDFGGHDLEVASVSFGGRTDPYIAVILGTKSTWRRSILCLFSTQGDLVYQEVMGYTRGILVTDWPKTNGEQAPVLLVGNGPGTVVKYERP